MNIDHDRETRHVGVPCPTTDVPFAALLAGDEVDIDTEGGSHYRFVLSGAGSTGPCGVLVRDSGPSHWTATAIGTLDPDTCVLELGTFVLGRRALFAVLRTRDESDGGFERLLTSRVIRLLHRTSARPWP